MLIVYPANVNEAEYCYIHENQLVIIVDGKNAKLFLTNKEIDMLLAIKFPDKVPNLPQKRKLEDGNTLLDYFKVKKVVAPTNFNV